MKKIILALTALAALALTGCTKVDVSNGYVGKKITPQGIQPELYQIGRYREYYRENMVLLDVSSNRRVAPVSVIMADYGKNEDGVVEKRIGLTMDFSVNLRYRLRSDNQTITNMLKDMKLDGVKTVQATQVYDKYGNMIVGRVVREVLGDYTPEEVLDNLDEINKELDSKIKKAFDQTPLVASSVSLGKITLPRVITDRITANKNTELSIAQKRAEQEIALLEKQNEIALAEQQAVREQVDAYSLAEQNRILAESVTPEVLRLRELEIRKLEIEMMGRFSNGNNSTVFIPYGAIDDVGTNVRMMNQ